MYGLHTPRVLITGVNYFTLGYDFEMTNSWDCVGHWCI